MRMPKYSAEQILLLVPAEVQALDVQEKVATQAAQQTQRMPEDVYAMMRAYSKKLPTFAENYRESMDTLVQHFDTNHEDARNLIAGASFAYMLLAKQAMAAKVHTEINSDHVKDVSRRHQKYISETYKGIEPSDEPDQPGFSKVCLYSINAFKELMAERPIFATTVTNRMAEEMENQNQYACSDYLIGAILVYDAFVRQAHEDGMGSFVMTDFEGDSDDLFDFPLLWHPEAETIFPVDYTKHVN